MKTAEEWIRTGPSLYPTAGEFIHAIQLDALREGMRRAAEEVMNTMATGSPYENRLVMNGAILSAAEQLAEKDL